MAAQEASKMPSVAMVDAGPPTEKICERRGETLWPPRRWLKNIQQWWMQVHPFMKIHRREETFVAPLEGCWNSPTVTKAWAPFEEMV